MISVLCSERMSKVALFFPTRRSVQALEDPFSWLFRMPAVEMLEMTVFYLYSSKPCCLDGKHREEYHDGENSRVFILAREKWYNQHLKLVILTFKTIYKFCWLVSSCLLRVIPVRNSLKIFLQVFVPEKTYSKHFFLICCSVYFSVSFHLMLFCIGFRCTALVLRQSYTLHSGPPAPIF